MTNNITKLSPFFFLQSNRAAIFEKKRESSNVALEEKKKGILCIESTIKLLLCSFVQGLKEKRGKRKKERERKKEKDEREGWRERKKQRERERKRKKRKQKQESDRLLDPISPLQYIRQPSALPLLLEQNCCQFFSRNSERKRLPNVFVVIFFHFVGVCHKKYFSFRVVGEINFRSL